MLFVIKTKPSVLGENPQIVMHGVPHLLSFRFMTYLVQLQSQVGEGRCFSVNCSEKAKEQALQVLKHFNVQVSLADIFSRCQVGQGLFELPFMLARRSVHSRPCFSLLVSRSVSCTWFPRFLLELWQHLARL